ncbi:MAG: histidine kinase, partial [Casimicrobiaceae bacterium]
RGRAQVRPLFGSARSDRRGPFGSSTSFGAHLPVSVLRHSIAAVPNCIGHVDSRNDRAHRRRLLRRRSRANLEAEMGVSLAGAAFSRSDEDHHPVGIACLRGLTPGRFGLVLAVCALFTMRNTAPALFDSPDSWLERPIYFAQQLLFFLPTLIFVTVADNLSADSVPRRRIVALSAAVIAGGLMYPLLKYSFYVLVDHNDFFARRSTAWHFENVITNMFRPLIYGGPLTAVLYLVTHERKTSAELREAGLARVTIDRQLAEAQLQALQAQIEPHFLFNTLANVKELYRTEHAEGRQVLHDLSDYLRAALPQMRETASTLRGELALSLAYLRVLQVRMGERLQVKLLVADELLDARVPPMMLLTLVENAIKHGLNPLPQGGTVRICAARNGADIKIRVEDTGAGFQKKRGSGIGLANTCARLTALYGDAARLSIRPNVGGGVVAEIELPFERPNEAPLR